VVRRAIAHGESGEDAKAVDYGCLMAVLIAAVNEQQTQIKEQERSLKEQKAQVARLRADIERLRLSIRATTR
jgi:phage shock protein A